MRKIRTVCTLLLLVGSATSIAGADQHRDGNWWRTTNRPQKLSYLVGVFDGIVVGGNFAVWKSMNDPEPSAQDAVHRSAESFAAYSKMMSKVTNDQMADGLDEFYKDYRNRNIIVPDAFWVVLRTITGAPKPDVEQLIENLRKKASAD